MPFQTKGTIAEWKLIYEAIKDLNVGDVVSYDEFEVALGRDLRDNRGPYYRAVRELERVNQRTLEAVAGVGYRVVAANEHERLGNARGRRAHRQIKRGIEVLANTRRAELTPEEQVRSDDVLQRLAMHDQLLRKHTKQIKAIEERQKAVEDLARKRKDGDAEEQANALRLRHLETVLERHGLLESPEADSA